MTSAADKIPLPTRPGTLWDPQHAGTGSHYCGCCGQGYSAHGAPEDVARHFGVPLEKRHLICPASKEAWEEFNYQRRVADRAGARAEVIRSLEALARHDADVPLDQIVHLLPDYPEWS